MGLRKILIAAAVSSALLLLTGCSSGVLNSMNPLAPPSNTEASYQLGKRLIVENPGEPFTIRESKDALEENGIFYATWSIGNCTPLKNEKGDYANLYDAHLFLLTQECQSAEDAASIADDLYEKTKENYQIAEEHTSEFNNITYQVISYCCDEDNPYERGISAFATIDTTALCMEFNACESYPDDLQPLLEHFLAKCSQAEY